MYARTSCGIGALWRRACARAGCDIDVNMTERKVRDPDAITVEEASVIAGIPVSAVRRDRREGFFSRLAEYPSTTPNAREFGFQIEPDVGSRES